MIGHATHAHRLSKSKSKVTLEEPRRDLEGSKKIIEEGKTCPQKYSLYRDRRKIGS